jgi:Glyoxalase-like domain
MISRRLFLALTGGAILSPPSIRATDNSPSLLDHMILGCNNLDTGISFVEERTGIRALFGGVHPDRGTANALLSLGERHYLEIMAPDPKGKAVPPWAAKQLDVLKTSATPRLITWAIHPRDIDALANKLRALGMQVLGPFPGSRTRPDGSVLSWKTFNLADDHHGLLPFFIQWSAGSRHPSLDAPAGCQIQRFTAADPHPDELSKAYQRIGVDVHIERGQEPRLRARISGPKGTLDFNS